MSQHSRSRRLATRAVLALAAGVVAGVGAASPASADSAATIDQVETEESSVQVLVSLHDLPAGEQPDLDSVGLTVDGEVLEPTAELASDAEVAIERTTVLAIDVSLSMKGDRFDAAKSAAQTFIETAPDNLQIGIVTFAGDVEVVAAPTLDRATLAAAIADLELSRRTELYSGIEQALATAGADGARSVLVLSDGRDTSGAPVSGIADQVKDSGVPVDVVALEQRGAALQALEAVATAGDGQVFSADDPDALSRLFSDQAAILSSQLLVTAELPPGAGGDSSVAVSVDVAGVSLSDSALVRLAKAEGQPPAEEEATGPLPVEPPSFTISQPVMFAGIAGLALGTLLVALILSGVLDLKAKTTVDDRLSPYGHAAQRAKRQAAAKQPTTGVKQQAVEIADKALSAGVTEKLSTKLDAGGLKFTASEWVLVHAGLVVTAGVFGFLLTGGSLVPTLLLLVLGAVAPWIYLSQKASRRIKAFESQLADTLQLISGSLSAGLSFAQSLDTVVREGAEPIASEFRRVLIEQRLGVKVEDALEGVAERMRSDDFAWVVMAIGIQRQVGGNLAELLLTVAGTLREREYLRRQVKSLSAEGRLSGWILGALPVVFAIYLILVRRDYIDPMLTRPVGWVMLGAASVMMVIGGFWMRKTVRVEV